MTSPTSSAAQASVSLAPQTSFFRPLSRLRPSPILRSMLWRVTSELRRTHALGGSLPRPGHHPGAADRAFADAGSLIGPLTMTIAMDEFCSPSTCDSVAPSTRRLHDIKGNGAGATLLLPAEGVGPARPHRALERAEPVPARVLLHWLASDRGAGPANAEGLRWTPDPRGSRVRSDSPRIPHGKVTQWLRPIKRPCQGAILTR